VDVPSQQTSHRQTEKEFQPWLCKTERVLGLVYPEATMTAAGDNGAAPPAIAWCCLAIILALVVGVGAPDHLVLRHVVQTLPLWAAVVLGFRRSSATGWLALPFFLFWLVLMTFIWLFVLGIARIVTFSPLEIAMTILVGAASIVGVVMFARIRSRLPVWGMAALFVVAAAVQWVCFRMSLLPAIAHR
jgi:hypothetical protein